MDGFIKARGHMRKISRGVAWFPMIAVFAVTIILVLDIILRRTTEAITFRGSYELTELGMVIIIFLGFAVTQAEKGNIRVTVFIEKFPYRIKELIETGMAAFTAVLGGVTFYASVLLAMDYSRMNLTTGVLFIPQAPFCVIMAFGFFALTVVLIFDTLEHLLNAIKGGPIDKTAATRPKA